MISGHPDLIGGTVRRLDLMADYRISRASSDPTPSIDADYPPARLTERELVNAAEGSSPDYPTIERCLICLFPPGTRAKDHAIWCPHFVDRRKADNVNQAIEFLAAAGRRAGDR